MTDIIFRLVVFALIMGVSGWIVHLFFILMSLFSKKKGLIEIYYNKYHELYPEIIVMIVLIVFEILVLLQFVDLVF